VEGVDIMDLVDEVDGTIAGAELQYSLHDERIEG
jgi:hypothetical protein